MSDEAKKPIWKRWWAWLAVVIIIIAIATSGEDSAPTSSTVDVKAMPLNDYAQYLVKETVGEKTNNNELVFIQATGTNGFLTIEMNTSDNLTTNLYRTSLLGDSIEMYKKAYTDRPDLKALKLDWFTTLVDQKGNESEGSVMWIVIKKENAATINWDNVLADNLPKIADGYWQHPLFSK